MIKVLFFAQIREQLNCDSVQVDKVPADVKSLRELLGQKSDLWADILQSSTAIAAVNQTIASDDATLNAGDEVAFFPPVTGG